MASNYGTQISHYCLNAKINSNGVVMSQVNFASLKFFLTVSKLANLIQSTTVYTSVLHRAVPGTYDAMLTIRGCHFLFCFRSVRCVFRPQYICIIYARPSISARLK